MKFWAKHFLWCEMLAAFALFAAFVHWDRDCGAAVVDSVLKSNRSAVYGALASVFGTLLGFVVTAVAILLSFVATDTFALLRQSSHYQTLWRTYTSAIRILAFSTVAAIVALVADTEDSPARWALYGAVLCILLALVRIARCLWILEKVIAIVTQRRASTG